MSSFFGPFPWNDVLKNKNASECGSVFEEVIQMGIEQCVPYANGKNYSKPWFNKRCAAPMPFGKKIKHSMNGFSAERTVNESLFQNLVINGTKLSMKPRSL